MHLGELGLSFAEFLEGAEQLLVLLLDLLEQAPRGLAGQLRREGGQLRGRDGTGARVQQLGHRHAGTAAGLGLDRESVHQAAGTGDPHAHPGLGDISAIEDGLKVADARASLADADQHPRRRTRLDEELDAAPAGVLERVAGDLRRGRRDPRLVELGEPQQPGDLARPLPGQHDVRLEADLQG